jgi:hypothetical protein
METEMKDVKEEMSIAMGMDRASPTGLSGDFIWTPVTAEGPAPVALHIDTEMALAETVEAGEFLEVITSGTCLVERPDGTRLLVKIAQGRIHGPARVLQIDDLSDADILAHRPTERLSAFIALINAGLAAVLALQALWLMAVHLPSVQADPLTWAVLSLIAVGASWLVMTLLRSIRREDLPGALAAPLRVLTRTRGPDRELPA